MVELVFKGTNNLALTNSLLVAEKFGKEHKVVLTAIRKLLERSAQNCAVLGMFSETTYFTEQNKELPMYVMNRDGFTLLVMGFTGDKAFEFKLDYIDAFNRMEKAIKESSLLGSGNVLEAKMMAAAWAADFLNMNEVSRLKLAKAVLEPLGLPSPDYVSSKGVMHSASELLKRFGSKLSILKFNQKMVELGFLKEETRQGKSKLHKFKVITAKGQIYGENQVSPKNQNETQPRWYDDKFEELLQAI